jgi:hypothetical protein
MRRSELLKVSVHCPHFKKPVAATRNAAIDRLVDCDEKDACRQPRPDGSASSEHDRPFPHGCPVFPSLAR